MSRDPYLGIMVLMDDTAKSRVPTWCCLGEVIKAEKEDIIIKADGHELTKEDLLFADWLRPEWEEEASITMEQELTMVGKLNGSASPCPNGYHTYFNVSSISGGRIADGKARYKKDMRLKAKDQVLLIPNAERQKYFVICKVVSWSSGAIPAD